MVPSLDWFVYSFVRKEAVISSQIEGTQASLDDLLATEAEAPVDAPPEWQLRRRPPNHDPLDTRLAGPAQDLGQVGRRPLVGEQEGHPQGHQPRRRADHQQLEGLVQARKSPRFGQVTDHHRANRLVAITVPARQSSEFRLRRRWHKQRDRPRALRAQPACRRCWRMLPTTRRNTKAPSIFR